VIIIIPAAIVALALLLLRFALGSRRGGGNQHERDVAAHEANRRAGRWCAGRCRWCYDERIDAEYSTLIADGYSGAAAEAETARRLRRGDYGER
jgi:hypothetical protein